jgi:hypothetical protein
LGHKDYVITDMTDIVPTGIQLPSLENLQIQNEIVLYEKENPDALINLLPPVVADAILEHSQNHPEFFNVDEHALKKAIIEVGGKGGGISPMDNRIRINFWLEYDRVMARRRDGDQTSKMMNMSTAIAGVCSRELFYKHYLRSYTRVAWLVCPPVNYTMKATEALEFGLEQLREVLDLPNVDSKGNPNAKLAAIKVKIVEMLDMRIKGAIVQRSMNVNVNTGGSQNVNQAVLDTTVEALETRLKLLRSKERESRNLPPVSDTPPLVEKQIKEVKAE